MLDIKNSGRLLLALELALALSAEAAGACCCAGENATLASLPKRKPLAGVKADNPGNALLAEDAAAADAGPPGADGAESNEKTNPSDFAAADAELAGALATLGANDAIACVSAVGSNENAPGLKLNADEAGEDDELKSLPNAKLFEVLAALASSFVATPNAAGEKSNENVKPAAFASKLEIFSEDIFQLQFQQNELQLCISSNNFKQNLRSFMHRMQEM